MRTTRWHSFVSNDLPTRAQRSALSLPLELSRETRWECDLGAHSAVTFAHESNVDVTERMRHPTLGVAQRTQRRRDANGAEPRARGADAEHCREQTVIRVCRPGVCVGTRGLRILRRGSQPEP